MKIIFLTMIVPFYLFGSTAFISAEKLRNDLTSNVVILDTTDQATYQKGHIPNAVMVDISKFRHQVGSYQLMNSVEEIEEVARTLGINNDSRVVIYGHNKGKELLKASYIALSLIINGCKNVSILDGGYQDWLSEYEIDELFSKEATLPKRGNFIAKREENILVNIDYVKSHIGEVPMIEARPLKFFNGSEQSKGVKRLGHISKAQSSYWREKFDEEYKLKSNESLNDIFVKHHNLTKDEEVITYCTGGLEASMNWYVLSQHLGFKNIKIYDGSMREWGNRDDTPMEK